MTETELDNFKSKVASKFSKLGELNAGKGKLDPQEEYVFELVEKSAKLMPVGQTKEDKESGKAPAKKMHAALTWKETKSGILVFQKLQIETLSWGTGQSDPFRSKVISFMEDIGIQCPKDQIPVWGNVFIKTMKIRARIVPSTKNNAIVENEYLFRAGSFRKYQS